MFENGAATLHDEEGRAVFAFGILRGAGAGGALQGLTGGARRVCRETNDDAKAKRSEGHGRARSMSG
jgi:hypothetical protein